MIPIWTSLRQPREATPSRNADGAAGRGLGPGGGGGRRGAPARPAADARRPPLRRGRRGGRRGARLDRPGGAARAPPLGGGRGPLERLREGRARGADPADDGRHRGRARPFPGPRGSGRRPGRPGRREERDGRGPGDGLRRRARGARPLRPEGRSGDGSSARTTGARARASASSAPGSPPSSPATATRSGRASRPAARPTRPSASSGPRPSVAGSGGELAGVDWDSGLLVPLGAEPRASASPAGDYPVDLLALRFADPGEAARAARLLAPLVPAGSAVTTPTQAVEQYRAAHRSFDRVVLLVSILTAASAAFGVTNLLRASVRARSLEIGLRRAAGARREDVRLQFLAEGLLLGLGGGLLGILLGVAPLAHAPLARRVDAALRAGDAPPPRRGLGRVRHRRRHPPRERGGRARPGRDAEARVIAGLLLAAALASTSFSAPAVSAPAAPPAEELPVAKAVETALTGNPDLLDAVDSAAIAAASLSSARSAFLPQVTPFLAPDVPGRRRPRAEPLRRHRLGAAPVRPAPLRDRRGGPARGGRGVELLLLALALAAAPARPRPRRHARAAPRGGQAGRDRRPEPLDPEAAHGRRRLERLPRRRSSRTSS